MEHPLTTYIRTKLVFKERLKDLKPGEYDVVKVSTTELKRFNYDYGMLLKVLRDRGEVWYDMKGNFRPFQREGPIDPTMLAKKSDRPKTQLTSLHKWMRDQLKFVGLDVEPERMSVYFKAFLSHKHKCLEPFFTVDDFSQRIHTPVVNMKSELRPNLRFFGDRLVSLDVKQMQPTILAKVLLRTVGKNPFSTAIFSGQDVYVMLQKSAGLKNRKDAKGLLFKLIFGYPKRDIGRMFKGDTAWVDWINHYKSNKESKNPHNEKPHTNLAWLLQYSEVRVMTDIWSALRSNNIPFLSIHDDILCRPMHEQRVHEVMDGVLKKHFSSYQITVTKH